MEDGLVVLWGADMDPSVARRRWPGARFVARARLAGEEPARWGILLRLPGPADGAPVAVVTDEGQALAAVPVTTAADLADPAAVLAAARYWELPGAGVAATGGEAGTATR